MTRVRVRSRGTAGLHHFLAGLECIAQGLGNLELLAVQARADSGLQAMFSLSKGDENRVIQTPSRQRGPG